MNTYDESDYDSALDDHFGDDLLRLEVPPMKLGRFQEARIEFARAAALAGNTRERGLLLKRAAECAEDRSK